MRKITLLLCLFLSFQLLPAQTSLNISLLSQVSTPDDLNDVWGYIDGNGKEYAICGVQSGGEIIVDVTNPASPSIVQTLPGVGSVWRDIKVFGDYAYVSTEDGNSGIRIIDLSGLPSSVNYKDTVINQTETAHNLWLADGYLYVVGGSNNDGMEIWNLNNNPWIPEYVGSYSSNYVHDVYVRNDTAYSCELSQGLTVVDVTNKAAPQIIGNKQYAGNFTHNSWLNDAGDVCFTTDEVTSGYLIAWDVSDPGNIQELDRTHSSLGQGASIPHNAHVINDYVVTSWYRDGMVVIDGSRPHNLIEVGYYDTTPLSGDGYDSNWGAWPFFPSGTCVASTQDGGLFVFNVDYKRGCYLEGMVTDSVTGSPISGATIDITTANVTDLSNTSGEYATGVADSGTYNVTYSAFGYNSKTISVSLDNGQLVIENVELAPLQRVELTLNVVETGTLTPIPNAQVSLEESNGQTLAYTANTSGVVNDTAFVQGSWTAIAGKWGWHANTATFNSNSAVTVTIELDPGYYDEFALDLGWTVSSTATSGEWERGEPVGTELGPGFPSNPDNDVPGDLGDQCYVTGNGGGGAGDDDIDGGSTTLSSPIMDLSGYTNPTLSYARWFANGGGFGGGVNDTLRVEISNGLTTVVLDRITGQNENTWKIDDFQIESYIALSSSMTVRFIGMDISPGHVAECAVDVFGVENGPVSNDPGLVDNDGYLRVFPNPLTDASRVEYDLKQDGRFEITDMAGRTVFSRDLRSGHAMFNLGIDIPSGMYLGVLRSADGSVKTFRIVK